MGPFGKLIVAGIGIFAVAQFVHPGIPAQPATAEINVPREVKQILEKNCYSCHSDERRLSWFDEIVPAYWLVRHDVLTARQHLNFSTLGKKPKAAQMATLYEAVNMVQLGAMPLPNFVKLHPEAKVSAAEMETLKHYLAPWGVAPSAASGKSETSSAAISPNAVQAEFNGLAFDGTFKNWKLISTTDRGDNHTFRFILGNEVAMKAARTGQFSPWPDNARFAKIAWQQSLGEDGLVHPGAFVQVELMVKQADVYKETEGWGWGRWRGMELKPYGQDAQFVSECTSCHQPMNGNDYVYTLPISAATVNLAEGANQRAAALPKNLPYEVLGWSVITMYVDPAAHTTATLFGNDAAMKAVQAGVRGSAVVYPEGAVLGLVTWAQREDPHWFGARIPDVAQKVEFVKVSPGTSEYRRFAGVGLAEDQAGSEERARATNFLLGLTPVEMPF